jgi:hypothetical protein
MTVEILSLSSLSVAQAQQAADALLDIDNGADRLERLLVLDDTALLDEHAAVYQHIEAANRVEKVQCVTAGPRAGDGRKLELPGNLGGTLGWPVLWVSRPGGINWRVAKSAKANRHPGSVPATLDQQHPLIRLLSVDEMFDRVYERLDHEVPGRVASPGLWLAGADDEAATFAGALAVAIRRVCEPGPGTDGPFGELLPARAGGARLSESGPLARYLGRMAEMDREASRALGKLGGLGAMLKRGDNDVQRYVIKVGEALTDLHDLTVQLLREASAAGIAGELTVNQRDLVRNAGLEFEAETSPRPLSGTAGSAAEQSLIYRTLARAVRGGDSIPLMAKRMIATERQITRRGSASYLPEVDKSCPPSLLAQFADAPQRVPRRAAVAEARRELGLHDAQAAAQALKDLILDVANREWSPASVTSRELAGARAALDGTRKALTEHASTTGGVRGGARGARLSRLGERLLPVLCDLVLHAVAVELASPSASGQEALRAAHDGAAGMLDEWTRQVQAHGVAAQPPFANYGAHDALHGMADDAAGVRDALLYPASDEMWQLCAPADLSALDVDAPLISILFASRLNKEALTGTVPGDEPVWTSSGSFAGLLRLVSLRAGVASWNWAKANAGGMSTATEP